MTTFPTALYILLAIAALLAVLAIRGFLQTGKLAPQHRTWLLIVGIFVLVSVVVPMLNA